MGQFDAGLQAVYAAKLFSGIPRDQVDALLGKAPEIRRYAQGEVIFRPESFQRALAFMLDGSALVYKVGTDGRQTLMSRLLPGSLFGMATLFTEQARFPTEIRAEREAAALFWPKARVEAALGRDARLAANYIALLSERIHFLSRRIDTLSVSDMPSRLMQLLRTLDAEQGRDGHILLPYSLSQLAQLLGVGRASLYRTLDQLAEKGLLSQSGRSITLSPVPKDEPTDEMEALT